MIRLLYIIPVLICAVLLTEPYNITQNKVSYETQYVAEYSDGHTEEVCTELLPPRTVGGSFRAKGSMWRVEKVMDYWYNGLQYGTQYYVAKVRMI